MPSFIHTNINALDTARQLTKTQQTLTTVMERLSSGKRVNSAKDDAAGLNVAALMTTQINGMNQAIRNAYDGISLAQTAEGALSVSSDNLQRMRELAIQASNATYSASDRQALQEEVNQLASQLGDVAGMTSFNGQRLFDGTMGMQPFQVGANASETVWVGGTNFSPSAYGNNRLDSGAVQPGTALAAGVQLTVASSQGTATVTTQAGDSARSVAAAINAQSGETGVTASAATAVSVGNLQAGASYAFEMVSNNASPVSVSFTVGANGDLSSAVSAFNQQSAQTGVVAQTDAVTGGVKLTNAAGETIGLQAKPGSTGVTMASYGAGGALSTAATITDSSMTEAVGTVTLNAPGAFSVTESMPLGGMALAGYSGLDSVASVNVAIFEDAQRAITTIDSALGAINSERAKYGAMQNRLEATVNNLMIGAESAAAARSRVMDTDYAQAVSGMSRAMLLQQVGVAMQAQANQAPQVVLSLLR